MLKYATIIMTLRICKAKLLYCTDTDTHRFC